MPSPFPGMDPYLERPAHWPGRHVDLIVGIKHALIPSLPRAYVVRTETTVYVNEPPAEERVLHARADDAIVVGALPATDRVATSSTTATAPSKRTRFSVAMDYEKHRHLEIRTADGERVITIIELLSPTNKDRHRDEYIKKRQDILDAGVHYLQLDLLRAGDPLLPDGEPTQAFDYNAVLVRAERTEHGGYKREADVWYWHVRDPLPKLPVPLEEDDADLVLDLRAVIDGAYDAGDYSRDLYRHPPEPPLSPEDQAWAAGLLQAAGIKAAS